MEKESSSEVTTTITDIPTTTHETHKQSAWSGLSRAAGWFGRVWLVTAQVIGSFILLMIILVVVAAWGSSGEATLPEEAYISGSGWDKVAVVSLQGLIGEGGDQLLSSSTGINARSVSQLLRQAENDDQVKAVILQINSPGGSAVVSDEIYEEVEDFKARSKKPVVASLADTAASGGYYVAAAADKIVANPSTITGSIGVIMEYYDASGLMQNLGVSSEVIKSGAYKDIGSLSRQTTPEERQILQSVVDGAYEQFVNRVAEGRSMDEDAVRKLADGRIYTGAQAKENGLVDEVGNLNQAVSVVKKLANIDEATVVRYSSGGWWQTLLNSTSKLTPWTMMASEVSEGYGLRGKLQYRWIP